MPRQDANRVLTLCRVLVDKSIQAGLICLAFPGYTELICCCWLVGGTIGSKVGRNEQGVFGRRLP